MNKIWISKRNRGGCTSNTGSNGETFVENVGGEEDGEGESSGVYQTVLANVGKARNKVSDNRKSK